MNLYEDYLTSLEAQEVADQDSIPSVTEWMERSIILGDGEHISLEPHQKAVLDHAFAFDEEGKLPYSIIVYSCPKKSGKTALNAAIISYWAYEIEAPNEIICVANKFEQAARPFREAKKYIYRNPELLNKTTRITERVVELKNGSTLVAIPNDFAGEAGSNHGLTTWDELWGFTTENARRLYDELTPVPTRKTSIRFITTYAGFEGESGLLEDLYHIIFDEHRNVKDGVERPLGEDFPVYVKGELFMYWDHQARMTWQTPNYYRSQKETLRPNNYLRLHENQWVSSESGLFNMEMWDKCVDENHRPPLPDKSVHLYVGVDASVKKDRSAVVTVYLENGLKKLGPKRFWQPTPEDPMDLEETMEKYLEELYQGYTIQTIKYDPTQFHRSATTLKKKGLPMEEYPQVSSNLTDMSQNLYDLVAYKNIVLYACKDLRYEATCAIAKETSRGLKIVKQKSTQKIDQIVALAMGALDMSKSNSLFSRSLDANS